MVITVMGRPLVSPPGGKPWQPIHVARVPVSADRTFLTAGTSEGIELVLGALLDEKSDILVPMPMHSYIRR